MKVFIMGGGGTLGSCISYAIACRGIADELVLYDIFRQGAAHHAFDISEASCLLNDTKVMAGGTEDMKDADIVINAMGLPLDWTKITPAENMERLSGIIKEAAAQIKTLAPGAVVISVTNPLDPVNYYLILITVLWRRMNINAAPATITRSSTVKNVPTLKASFKVKFAVVVLPA